MILAHKPEFKLAYIDLKLHFFFFGVITVAQASSE